MSENNENDAGVTATGEEKDVVIENTMIPLIVPGVTIREEVEDDGRFILFNAENELILVINPTGKYILDNCDGEKNVAVISEAIKNDFTTENDMDVFSVVKEFVALLLKAELITLKE